MDQACNRAHGPWPGTAAVRVRELGWQGPYNPRPQSKDPGSRRDSHGERLVQEYLSPARLVSAGGLGLRPQGSAWGTTVPGPMSSQPSGLDERSQPCGVLRAAPGIGDSEAGRLAGIAQCTRGPGISSRSANRSGSQGSP